MSRLAADPDFALVVDQAAAVGGGAFFGNLAATLARRKNRQAIDLSGVLLRSNLGDLASVLRVVESFVDQGAPELAIELLLALREWGAGGDAIFPTTQAVLMTSGQAYDVSIAAGDFDRALAICELLIKLAPGAVLYQRASLETQGLMCQRQRAQTEASEQRRLHALDALATACETRGDFETELRCRIGVFRHPLVHTQHSAFQISNIFHALSRILSVDVARLEPSRRTLAQEMLATAAALPHSGIVPGHNDSLAVVTWEHAVRLLLSTIDLVAIFGDPAAPTPPLPTCFVASSGEALTLADIAMRSNSMAARMLFVTSASAEYFTLHAGNYISSILANADCSCMIVIYVCAPASRLVALAATVAIDDPRVLYASDHFDPSATIWQLFALTRPDPANVAGIYYASSGLLHIDELLQNLCLPICTTGIDTILQRGVADLIERFSDADVVFNRLGGHTLLGGQLVNNLVLTYPTANGLLFCHFLKSYLGRHVLQTVQPEYLDQLDLLMAKHHLQTHGNSPVIRYFDFFDINNIMFNAENYRKSIELIRQFRFLNVFFAGCKESALTPDDVAGMASAPAAHSTAIKDDALAI